MPWQMKSSFFITVEPTIAGNIVSQVGGLGNEGGKKDPRSEENGGNRETYALPAGCFSVVTSATPTQLIARLPRTVADCRESPSSTAELKTPSTGESSEKIITLLRGLYLYN